MTNTPKVRLSNLYKIFGADSQAALKHVRAGVGKEDLLVQHQHVLGLQDINVDMQAGEITVVMGLSGSGKSTLIRHLNRLIDPTAGEIIVDGEDVMKLSEGGLRNLRQEKMSMVFQKFALLPHRTVVQNAAMPLKVRGFDEEKQRELLEHHRHLFLPKIAQPTLGKFHDVFAIDDDLARRRVDQPV